MKRLTIILALVALLGGGGWFLATLFPQTGIGQDESQVSATYAFGDWKVECTARDDGLPCEMKQSILDGSTGTTLAVLTIVYVPDVDRHAFQIRVPPGIWTEPGIDVSANEAASTGVAISGCAPSACFMNALLVDPMLSQMKEGGEGRFTLHDKNKNKVAVPFSLEGFAGAEEKLRQQTSLLTKGHPAYAWTVDQIDKWFGDEVP